MTRSDLLSRMYPMPLSTMSRRQQTLTATLRSTDASQPTEIYARNAYCSNASVSISSSSPGPYIKRVHWLLRNSQGLYLVDRQGTVLLWSANPDDVPERYRKGWDGARALWVRIRDLLPSQDSALAIVPITFYAHCSTPHLWCAAND